MKLSERLREAGIMETTAPYSDKHLKLKGVRINAAVIAEIEQLERKAEAYDDLLKHPKAAMFGGMIADSMDRKGRDK